MYRIRSLYNYKMKSRKYNSSIFTVSPFLLAHQIWLVRLLLKAAEPLPMPGTNPVTVQTMPTIPCTTACQGESVISQAWLKQFTAHKASLMYCLFWGKKHSNPTIHYDTFPSLQQFPPQATLCLQQRSLTFCACKKTYPYCRDAKRNICVLRRTQNWLFVCACVCVCVPV